MALWPVTNEHARPAGSDGASRWIVPLLVTLVLVVAFHRFWNHSLIFRDSFHNFAPYKYLLAQELRGGSLPAWYPWSFLGMPFAGNLEAGCFYPLNALYLLFPFELAHRLYILVHYPLAAIFLTAFLRGRGLAWMPAALGGLAYSLSGYLTSQHGTTTMLIGAAWAPLALFCADRALNRGSPGWAIAPGAVLAIQVLGGEPQSALITAVLVSAVCIASLRKAPRRALGVLGMSAVSSAILAAVQLLPSYEMMSRTVRGGGLDLQNSTIFSFHPGRIVELLWPAPFGPHWPESDFWGSFALDAQYNTLWSNTVYLGVAVLTLAVLGVSRSRPVGVAAAIAAVVFFFIALGHHSPVYAFLHETVPLFDLFRYPAKYIAWFTGCVAVLAALGFQRILEWSEARPSTLARGAAFYMGGVVALAAASIAVWPVVVARVTGEGAGSVVYDSALSGLTWSGAHLVVVSLLVGGLVLFLGRGLVPVRFAGPLLLAVLVADWTVVNVGVMPAGPRDIFELRPVLAEALEPRGRPRLGEYRVFRQPMRFPDPDPAVSPYTLVRKRLWDRQTLKRNFDAMEGFEGLVGYSGSKLAGGLDLLSGNLNLRVLELLNVRYVIGPFGLRPTESGGIEVAYSDRRMNVTILRMLDALPRAYWVSTARYARDEQQALELLLADSSGRSVVLIGDGTEDDTPEPGPPVVPVTMRSYETDRVVVETNVDRDGWLVLSDRYFSGWTARLDGEPLPIRRANVVVRAVHVPPGKHTVEFLYAPASLRIGGVVTLAGWAAAAVLWGVAGWRSRRARPAHQDGARAKVLYGE